MLSQSAAASLRVGMGSKHLLFRMNGTNTTKNHSSLRGGGGGGVEAAPELFISTIVWYKYWTSNCGNSRGDSWMLCSVPAMELYLASG